MSSMNPVRPAGLGRIEFVLLISAVMMIVAFTIDSMLPALPAIGSSLGVADEGRWPLVIAVFLAGFGLSQLFVGVVSDRYGRRGPILWSIFGFGLTSLAASLAPTFEHLLVARFAQGITCAGARVIVTSIIRDRFEGRDMAQVMSLSSMIFMAAPILAPTMGQFVLSFATWRWIFAVLAAIGLGLWIWLMLRLPETLAPENKISVSTPIVLASARTVVTDRMSLGYGLAMTVLSCPLFGFLMSVQAIFQHSFGRPDFLPAGFAIMAAGMAAASFLNAAIVKRLGKRRISHLALFFFTAMAGIHVLVAFSGHETLTSFVVLQMIVMMGFALFMGNFGAMAMENMSQVAGMASSIQGSLSSIAAAVIGALVGRAFDGTTVPLYFSFLVSGAVALAIVYVTERGRFFVAHHAPSALAGD